MLTVETIANKTFRRTLLGYDLEQVDDFLDEIIQQLQQMEQERREMTATIDYLVAELRAAGQSKAAVAPEDIFTEPVSPHIKPQESEKNG